MNEFEIVETDLQKLEPARPPEELMARLAAAQPAPRALPLPQTAPLRRIATSHPLFRWLAPVTAAAAMLIGLSLWHSIHSAGKPRGQTFAVFAKPTLKTDDVEIDRRLVAAYDAVAQLPGGEPVRFRCREWTDNMVLRDPVRGVVIEQRTPRMEIVPVRIETY
jgi:hypothetical protein